MSRAKKHFGQHFLHDRTYLDRIVASIAARPSDRLVEIGPGEGAMTFPLLKAAGTLTAIELDTDLIPRLRERAADLGTLEIVQADVLTVDFTSLATTAGQPLRVVGNLPYYISSPILFHCLEHIDAIVDMHFMLQKEVVDRMAAAPGSKIYGRLSVMLQLVCEVVSLFVVPPGAFQPPPKVDSAVVRLRPRPPEQRPDVDPKHLQAVVRAAFAQRRKTLANGLKGLLDADTIAACGIDPKARAETLPPSAFVDLARALGR
ncbi:16S rRNA (adenine(1518)-N(6)/adenine(1519)-N(6))-dimethyltransferase RsmA [Oleiagrimonas soli]|uniref:Ribosomal RNA small subunit methyltransferase A n=1 Tax=Oleiagrimonas soli TaxID=1543381 RepID=A0A099CVM0_9GAMM|nr:16S rRNA (adenine(1518)-N(6)/adenine(1519)-N(6))-dimethyltransferase RsmA [Oleiagrimonas soli]KGI77050.1 ribosomal RNA small subunit methyltransferase A [Oleiagrimonas soli]MBB6185425.1 16S rRNA (adenine1518-N6/adenine1519-N6)-dimethyltransferase [Oleiagrimonas soli]